jgi:hypothetical protein
MIQRYLIGLYLILWALCGFYFGVSGVTNVQFYEELKEIPKDHYTLQFDSTKALKPYTFRGKLYSSLGSAEEAEIADKVLPVYRWLFSVSDSTILVLSSCFLGAFGSIIRISIKMLIEKNLTAKMCLLLPFFGFSVGFIVLCISYALPKYLTTNSDVNLNPISIMVISLLAGIYYDLFIKWLQGLATSLFTNLKE